MRDATLVFLVKKDIKGIIKSVLLAMKKRGFGVGRWNGVGGKIQSETIEEAAIREAAEEIGVEITELKKGAELQFYFKDSPQWDQLVHVYSTEKWKGEPLESEEMAPKWFKIKDIPFDQMWVDDIYWIPEFLKGNLIKGRFTFGKNDSLLDQSISIVNDFSS